MKTFLYACIATLMFAIAVTLLASTSYAQIGAAAGGTRDWIKVSKDADWSDQTTFMPAISYHFGLNQGGPDGTATEGMTATFRGSDGDAIIQEWSIGYWAQTPYLEWFGDGVFETWSGELTGSREFLGGARLGIRAMALEGLPVEVSARWTVGADGIAHPGLFFGVYK